MSDYPDFITGPILEGQGSEYFVELYNRLQGYKVLAEALEKPLPDGLTNQIAKLLELYPDAEKISLEWQRNRRKESR